MVLNYLASRNRTVPNIRAIQHQSVNNETFFPAMAGKKVSLHVKHSQKITGAPRSLRV